MRVQISLIRELLPYLTQFCNEKPVLAPNPLSRLDLEGPMQVLGTPTGTGNGSKQFDGLCLLSLM